MKDTPSENNNSESKISEIQISKFPMAESPNLIEYFLIMGYEESYIQEKIIPTVNPQLIAELEELESKARKISTITKIYNEFKCRHQPTILSSITSNFEGGMLNTLQMIDYVFPIPPSIFYSSADNCLSDPYPINVVFTNIQNNVVNIGYAYIFYENRTFNKIKYYIPKAFVIISQYPFFNTFNKICQELLIKQFKNRQLQIPVEIQIFNIVNFIKVSIDSKLNISLFPSNELSEMAKCGNDKELIDLKDQQIYTINHLSGFRQSEIDLSVIFCVLPVDIIIQIYLELLTGHYVAFFSKSIEILHLTMYIFQQFFYPLAHEENVISLSPVKYFCSSDIFPTLIIGFVCSYDEVENYNPFRELKEGEFKCFTEKEESKELDLQYYSCDFVIDLDKKIFKDVDNSSNTIPNWEKYKDDTLEILEYVKKIISSNKENDSTELEHAISKLLNNLKEISFKLTYSQTKKIIPNYFNCNDKFNIRILEAFYQFNLDFSYLYYKYFSEYSGDYNFSQEQKRKNKTKEESDLSDYEYLFFESFSKTPICDELSNFIGGVLQSEVKLYDVPKRIFENFLSLKRLNNKNKSLINNYFSIIDEVYIANEGEKYREKDVTFLNFYKFYKDDLSLKIFNLISNKYVDAKVNKANRQNIKYFYEYKTIDFDKDLLTNYAYIIERLTPEQRKKIFPNDGNYLTYKPINLKITSIEIYDKFEKFYIDSKLLKYEDILIISILNIVTLSIKNKTLVPFNIQIYSLLKKLKFSVRKYVEMILSISLRLFSKEKTHNLNFYEKYFGIYYIGIEDNNLFPTDELIVLHKEIDKFIEDIKKSNNIIEEKINITEFENKKAYSLDSKMKNDTIIPVIQNLSFSGTVKSKLTIKSKLYKGKHTTFTEIYSPVMLYNKTNKMLNMYYNDLNYKIDNEEYSKILIFLMFYCQILDKEVPDNTDKFLLYCLSFNN